MIAISILVGFIAGALLAWLMIYNELRKEEKKDEADFN